MEQESCLIERKALEDNRNCISRLFFLWVDDLLEQGAKNPFKYDELYNILDEEKIDFIIEQDEKVEKSQKHLSLLQQIYYQISGLMTKCMIYQTVAAIFQFSGPIFLNLILGYLADPNQETYLGYVWASSLLVCIIIRALFDQHSKHQATKAGMMTVNRIYYRIFRKLMRISAQAKNFYDMGKINTMVLMNCQEIAMCFQFYPIMFSSPIIITLATAYIIYQIGWVGVFGPIILGFLTYSMNKLQTWTNMQRRFMLIHSSQRSKLANEFFQGIRIIKYYAWEQFVHRSFSDLRAKELQLVMKVANYRGIIEALQTIQPTLTAIVIFGLAVATGTTLTAQGVFTVLTLLNMLGLPLRMLVNAYSMMLSAYLAFQRIQAFLQAEDHQSVDELQHEQDVVAVNGASLSWESIQARKQFEENARLFNLQGKPPPPPPKNQIKAKETQQLATNSNAESPEKKPLNQSMITSVSTPEEIDKIYISGLNLRIQAGQMIAIIGKVGSGKSALLQGFLGEMNLIKGTVAVRGKIAYISQQVWLRNATIRDNITFGLPYDEAKFNEVIKICQLEADLSTLVGGDQTEVGERGINLSGGQKQRLSIARAVYSDSDIFFIDDCLSALDSYVGKRIFQDVIQTKLNGKTRIMVTHQLQYLQYFDLVAITQDGTLAEYGSYSEMKNNPNSILKQLTVELKASEETIEEEAVELEVKKQVSKQEVAKVVDVAKNKAAGTMIKQEEQMTGSIPWNIYAFYFREGGSCKVIFSMTMFFIAQATRQLCDWWLGQWSQDIYHLSDGDYIGIYGGIMLLSSVLFWVRYNVFSIVTTESSKNIFEKMVNVIMRAPLSWFDVTPLGRITTRCTKNVDDMDFMLSIYMQLSLVMLVTLFSTFIMISLVTPFFLLVAFVLSIYYLFRVKYYWQTVRELKRIGDIAKAPLIGVITEASLGVHIIRPFKRQKFYMNKFRYYCERHTAALYHEQWCQRWMSIRTEFFGALIISAAAYFGVASKGVIQISLIGLNLSYAIGVQIMLPFLVDILTQTETTMSSVQRMVQYIESVPSERAYNDPVPPTNWPSEGKFTIKNISFKYRDELDNVIKKISFDISPQQKIGVIGRTGSGKSTLTLGLLRILELSSDEGSIVLDGIDISSVGLYHLRSRLSIIPQDPVLFSGTLRKNIDPNGVFQDKDIVECLKKVSLYENLLTKTKADVPAEEAILTITIDEAGSNFSLGEKQLICLARALIRQPKVILMDEATASIDEKTDSIIQTMIQTEFKNSTVITIAHRLNTIITYDKILVLKYGEIEEYDTPLALLNRKSYLAEMVNEHGPEFARQMKQMAGG